LAERHFIAGSVRRIYDPKPAKECQRKLDKAALAAHVRDYPDALLRERAAHFGVHINAIWTALKKLKVTKKRRNTLSFITKKE
jgi:transposase